MSHVAAAATAHPQAPVTSLPVPHVTAPPVTAAAAPPAPMPQTFLQMHASWLTHTVAGIFIVAAIALVILLAVQTTKQEGLSGAIGGRVESAYRGRMGAEEQLQRITGIVAGIFVFCAFFLSLSGI